MRTGRVKIITGARPAGFEGHVIMNAPRPLLGTRVIEPRGPEGAFTVAIDLRDGNAGEIIALNRRDDACFVVYVPLDLLQTLGDALTLASVDTPEGIEDAVNVCVDNPDWTVDRALSSLLTL